MSSTPEVLTESNQRVTLRVGRLLVRGWTTAEFPEGDVPVSRFTPAGATGDVVAAAPAAAGGTLTLTQPFYKRTAAALYEQLKSYKGKPCSVDATWVDNEGNEDGAGRSFQGMLVGVRPPNYNYGAADSGMLTVVVETNGAA